MLHVHTKDSMHWRLIVWFGYGNRDIFCEVLHWRRNVGKILWSKTAGDYLSMKKKLTPQQIHPSHCSHTCTYCVHTVHVLVVTMYAYPTIHILITVYIYMSTYIHACMWLCVLLDGYWVSGNIFKARHQCCVRMTCNTPTPGHPSAADDAWYWQKRVLRIGWLPFLHLGLCDIWLFAAKGVVVHWF